jgi:hypothetical protein
LTVLTPPSPPDNEFAPTGFVALTEWVPLERALAGRLTERPTEPLVLECRQVTGFSLGALLALGSFIHSVSGRIHLRNWPAEAARALVLHLCAARALTEALAATATRRAANPGAPEREGIAEQEARLAAAAAELKRIWAGRSAVADPFDAARSAQASSEPSAN